MSLQRSTQPLTSSSYTLLKFFATSTTTTTRSHLPRPSPPCLRCQIHQTSKRTLSTATEYRPHTLDPAPPPPRNTNIPDTSIAGASPGINNAIPSRLPNQHGSPFPTQQQQPEAQSISETETEAQKSKPVAESTTKPQQRPTRLRARKATISLTPNATDQLRQLLSLPEPKFIRVGVRNRGCSGLAYHLEYVDKAGKFDESVEQDGVKVLIDSKALFSIIGSEMDWVEDKLSQRFVFRNPNIKEQCGCGESFMV